MPHEESPFQEFQTNIAEDLLNNHIIRGLLKTGEVLISIGQLEDVDLQGLVNGNLLQYDATEKIFKPASIASVLSFQPPETFIVDAAIISTRTITLAQIPANNSVFIDWNGQFLEFGPSGDFTVSGNVVTFSPQIDLPLTVGDSLRSRYLT